MSKETMGKIAGILKSHPGQVTIRILLQNGDGSVKTMDLPYTVNWKAIEKQVADLL